MIPAYYANETVGVDKLGDGENVLYAVWEPQVYIEFVNDTGDALHDVTLYIPSWTADGLFRVNEVAGTYRRESFTNFTEGAASQWSTSARGRWMRRWRPRSGPWRRRRT